MRRHTLLGHESYIAESTLEWLMLPIVSIFGVPAVQIGFPYTFLVTMETAEYYVALVNGPVVGGATRA